MTSETTDRYVKSISAVGALVIATVILMCVNLAFTSQVRAQTVQRPAAPQTAPETRVAAAAPAAGASVERGRYLVAVAGCNDCHTGGYAESGGRVPESEWLLGTPVGFRGPWGVSYPSNLRLTVQSMTEAQWMQFARVERLPPMPWFALRDMTEEDLRSLYRYIRALGPKGERAPAAVGPNGKVATPYILFVPQNMPPPVSQATPSKATGG